MRATRYSAEVIVLILARNIAWDEFASGKHTMFGTRTTMTGSGLIALHSHLTTLLQKKGAETSDEAATVTSWLVPRKPSAAGPTRLPAAVWVPKLS
jgi:hypothetical protein